MLYNLYYKLLRFLADRNWLTYPRFRLYWTGAKVTDVEVLKGQNGIEKRAALYFDKFSNESGVYDWADFKSKISTPGAEWLELAAHYTTMENIERYTLAINLEKNYFVKKEMGNRGEGVAKEEQYPLGKSLHLFPPFD